MEPLNWFFKNNRLCGDFNVSKDDDAIKYVYYDDVILKSIDKINNDYICYTDKNTKIFLKKKNFSRWFLKNKSEEQLKILDNYSLKIIDESDSFKLQTNKIYIEKM